MDSILQVVQFFVTFMNDGGAVMWTLFGLNFLLWYGLGYRYIVMQRGRKGNVRYIIEKQESQGDAYKVKGMIDNAVMEALKADQDAKKLNLKSSRDFIEDALSPYYNAVKKYGILVKTIVVLAPLIGLLGTVMGMIETFDALQSSSMFAQGDSISGGISKALFTTELGLVVAVPGLILGRAMDKKQERFTMEFEQITDIICTRDEDEN